jgi:membrane protease subunit HflK
MYLDAMQQVLSSTSKVILDYKGSGNLLYLPLDKLMQRGGTATPSESDASQTQAPAPTPDETSPRSRDSLRSRDRGERP